MKRRILDFAAFLARVLPTPVTRLFYRLGPLSQLIRGALTRAAPGGLTPVRISGGDLAWMTMALDLKIEKEYWLGTYEVDLQQAIRAQVRPEWVAYDVGANIGYVSLLLAKAVGDRGTVYAFEALPENLNRLRENIQLNRLSNRVKVIASAVVDFSQPVRFLVGPSGSMGKVSGSAGRLESKQIAIDVPGVALDDFVYRDGNPVPQVIKMDIEGGEVLALRGMARLLKQAHPLVFLELHGPDAARVAWDTLNACGYRICLMKRGLSPVLSLNHLEWKSYLVAVPRA